MLMMRTTQFIPVFLAGVFTASLGVSAQKFEISGASARVPIDVEARAVPLNPDDASQNAIGDFVFAGGLHVTARESNRFHELSDLEMLGPERFVAVSDAGLLVDLGGLEFARSRTRRWR